VLDRVAVPTLLKRITPVWSVKKYRLLVRLRSTGLALTVCLGKGKRTKYEEVQIYKTNSPKPIKIFNLPSFEKTEGGERSRRKLLKYAGPVGLGE